MGTNIKVHAASEEHSMESCVIIESYDSKTFMESVCAFMISKPGGTPQEFLHPGPEKQC